MAFLDEVGLAELWSLITAEDADVTAIANTKAKFKVGSYTGTGTYGQSTPCSLTFDFPPSVVFILSDGLGEQQGGTLGDVPVMLTQYRSYVDIGSNNTNKVAVTCTFSGNKVSWYSDTAKKQINTSGTVYPYIAIG